MEKVMKFINRNAYIIVAVKGYTFCGGALRAIKLIILNVGRLAAVNVIGDALIFLGKLTVTMACGSLAFLMTDLKSFSRVDSANYITSPIVPVILSMVAAYMVASVFFAVRQEACYACEGSELHGRCATRTGHGSRGGRTLRI